MPQLSCHVFLRFEFAGLYEMITRMSDITPLSNITLEPARFWPAVT